ncbi:unnamed protein product [Taenia asiatica]|uniref:Thioredoxin domain-containing protein n=1 Tax=Taenia asiatica TaxID=60517 RepID=A0A158RA65_TAEAS|nr:unnamed protein product [Taenia asiatica]
MRYVEKLRGINLFSRSLILFSFLLNLSVAIFAHYSLAWIYIQRGVVEGGAYQINTTDLYLSHYPEDLNRLIEMSRHFEKSVNMSRRHIISFVQSVSFRWNDSLNCHRAILCVTVVHILIFIVSLMGVNTHQTSSSEYYSAAIMYVGEIPLDLEFTASVASVVNSFPVEHGGEGDAEAGRRSQPFYYEIPEILSDPQKRAKYDAYGVYDLGDKSYSDEGPSPINPDLFANFFGGHFFPFGHVPRDENVEIQPLWSQIARRYSHLGVIFGIANIQDDHALREELNVLHSPSIVAVLDGKVSYFMRSEFTEEAIIDYLVQALLSTGPLRSSPLPGLPSTTLGTPLMKTVSSEAELSAFHAGWLEDSRPRALFIKAASRPPLRFCLAAFRAVDFYASGFVDTQNSLTEPIIQRLNLSRSEESIVIFHESPNEAVISHSASHLPRHIIDDMLMKNSRLVVPRILNSARFLDLCPADGRPPSSAFASAAETTKGTDQDGHTSHRHLCLVLLLHHRHYDKDRVWLNLFRSSLVPFISYALTTPLNLADLPRDFSPILSPAYMFIDRQSVWIDNITKSSTCPTCLESLADLDGHLLALWRISSRVLSFRLLPRNAGLHPAEISSVEGYTERLKKTLSGLVMDMVAVDNFLKSHDLRKVRENVAGWSLAYLPRMEALLVDELAAPLWLRIRLKAWSLCRTAISYFDGTSTNVCLVPACLFLDRYADWLGWALEAATRIPFRPSSSSSNTSNHVAMTFNPANCRGTVLAVNGYRRYFHMYHPLLPGAKSRSYSQASCSSFPIEYEIEDEEESYKVRRRHVPSSSSKESRRVTNFSRLLGLNRSSDEESDYESEDEDMVTPAIPLLEHEVLAGLPTWFDRLFEGSLRRYHVPEWPRHLTLSL